MVVKVEGLIHAKYVHQPPPRDPPELAQTRIFIGQALSPGTLSGINPERHQSSV